MRCVCSWLRVFTSLAPSFISKYAPNILIGDHCVFCHDIGYIRKRVRHLLTHLELTLLFSLDQSPGTEGIHLAQINSSSYKMKQCLGKVQLSVLGNQRQSLLPSLKRVKMLHKGFKEEAAHSPSSISGSCLLTNECESSVLGPSEFAALGEGNDYERRNLCALMNLPFFIKQKNYFI